MQPHCIPRRDASTGYRRGVRCSCGHPQIPKRKQMTKKEIIEDLTHKVADIKYDLQVVLEALYRLELEENE